MFRTSIHVAMPFCACGDDAKLVTGVRNEWHNIFQYVECTRCSHREQSRVENTRVTLILESGGPPPPNLRD